MLNCSIVLPYFNYCGEVWELMPLTPTHVSVTAELSIGKAAKSIPII